MPGLRIETNGSYCVRSWGVKKISIMIVLAVLAVAYFQSRAPSLPAPTEDMAAEIALQTAFANQANDIQVLGAGRVTRILSDDLEGSRHQRFILLLAWEDTLLVSHNIDLAPRIERLKVGDRVDFYGEYQWNHKGGVVHWTHHDPDGRHVGGWLKHEGRIYQ